MFILFFINELVRYLRTKMFVSHIKNKKETKLLQLAFKNRRTNSDQKKYVILMSGICTKNYVIWKLKTLEIKN